MAAPRSRVPGEKTRTERKPETAPAPAPAPAPARVAQGGGDRTIWPGQYVVVVAEREVPSGTVKKRMWQRGNKKGGVLKKLLHPRIVDRLQGHSQASPKETAERFVFSIPTEIAEAVPREPGDRFVFSVSNETVEEGFVSFPTIWYWGKSLYDEDHLVMPVPAGLERDIDKDAGSTAASAKALADIDKLLTGFDDRLAASNKVLDGIIGRKRA